MIETIYSQKKDFIIIGLTGRIGSGCSTSANFLSKNIDEHKLNEIELNKDSTDKNRKRYIIDKFYRKNWKPFTTIKASDIITIFLFKYNFDELIEILKEESLLPDITKLELEENNNLEDKYNNYHSLFKNLLEDIRNLEKITSEDLPNYYTKITVDLPKASKYLREELSKNGYKNYTDIFQKLGDNLRLYGDISSRKNSKEAKNIFTISQNINYIIKVIRKYNKEKKNPTYIAIDAIRNPLEAMFFKERYSAFYMIGINSDDEDIRIRLRDNQYLHDDEIKKQSEKETTAELLNSLEDFVSQNIKGCIEKSDIFIANNGTDKEKDLKELYGQLVKYISLMQHPGLITPSLDEKMMQIAYTAKLNSACLSRQVGASITNAYGSLKAIGWNSVADGQTPCLLRNQAELLSNSESKSYSIYEKSLDFKKMLKTQSSLDVKYGLNQSFCFKSIYTKNNPKEKGNQVHTRSLHAEENAFLQMAKYGGEALMGGTLYSTASPCELCSKKAYQLGIKRIVYIDPYPGIARQQILQSGTKEIKIALFTGAIGGAYHKMYEQIIPFKDEIKVLMESEK